MKKKRPKLRSGLEDRVKKQLEKKKVDYTYESVTIEYTVPSMVHKYKPDFIISRPSGEQILIECKGFWSDEDRYKHRLIFEQHPELDIRFVFSNARNRIRKGSPTTYGALCEGRGRGVWKDFRRQYSDKGILPESWLLEQPE